MVFLIGLVIVLIFFLYWNYFRPTSLWTGFFFLVALAVIYLGLVALLYQYQPNLMLVVVIPVIFIILVLSIFGVTASVIGLFWNEKVLISREGKSFSNLLPFLLGVSVLLVEIITFILSRFPKNPYLSQLTMFISFCFFYVFGVFLLYTVTSFLFNHFPIKREVDYIIILGAGLMGGEKVTPLLAGRVDRGIALYNKQVEQLNHHPVIVLSGGQGKDEKISEAKAMENYIKDKGYKVETLYLEEKSKNTDENIKFSEHVIAQRDSITDFRQKEIILATSNYHLLRAGKLAFHQGIPVRGVGSKTRLYYLPTAFIREYIGYLVLTRKKHYVILGAITIISIAQLLFTVLT